MATNDTYNTVLQTLCTQISKNADASILNETEGLDVYINVVEETSDVFAYGSTSNQFVNATDEAAVFIGFKKKSDPACTI